MNTTLGNAYARSVDQPSRPSALLMDQPVDEIDPDK
jgi:hypothetical protein